MPLVSMNEFLPKAKANQFAVGQFNMNNLEFAKAITEAAMEEKSPYIFGVSEGALKYMGIEYTVAIAEAAAKESGLPIALHLDHGSSFEVAMKCIRAGFSSVMFDGSHYSFEENIKLTKEVVKAAHAMGVSVEGELGTIGGVEDDNPPSTLKPLMSCYGRSASFRTRWRKRRNRSRRTASYAMCSNWHRSSTASIKRSAC